MLIWRWNLTGRLVLYLLNLATLTLFPHCLSILLVMNTSTASVSLYSKQQPSECPCMCFLGTWKISPVSFPAGCISLHIHQQGRQVLSPHSLAITYLSNLLSSVNWEIWYSPNFGVMLSLEFYPKQQVPINSNVTSIMYQVSIRLIWNFLFCTTGQNCFWTPHFVRLVVLSPSSPITILS